MSEVEIIIDEIGGNCPVQAEGTINGRRFYFRARGCRWSMQIAPEGVACGYLAWPETDGEWYHGEQWGNGPYDAGWMPEDTAREMIAKAAGLFVNATEPRP